MAEMASLEIAAGGKAAEAAAWLRAAAAVLVDHRAVTVDARAAPSPTPSEMPAWLTRTLGPTRGVLSAWPALPGLSARASERVLALSSKTSAGGAWWWLHHLQRTVFSRRDSYTTLARTASDANTGQSVYRLVGEPGSSFDWFPGGATYGLDKGVIEAFLHFGLTVTVREQDVTGRAPALEVQEEQAALAQL